MPQEITKPTPLLKEDGSTVVGWASSNLLDYNKIDCAAPLARIKEWDRYTVVSPDCAVTLSIADLGNLGYIFASLTDFTQKPCRTFSQSLPQRTHESPPFRQIRGYHLHQQAGRDAFFPFCKIPLSKLRICKLL